MAIAIARTAHGSGIAAATSDALTAFAEVTLCIAAAEARAGAGVSGPCHPARAGTNCAGAGSASKRLRSGRIGVAWTGTVAAAKETTTRVIPTQLRLWELNPDT